MDKKKFIFQILNLIKKVGKLIFNEKDEISLDE